MSKYSTLQRFQLSSFNKVIDNVKDMFLVGIGEGFDIFKTFKGLLIYPYPGASMKRGIAGGVLVP